MRNFLIVLILLLTAVGSQDVGAQAKGEPRLSGRLFEVMPKKRIEYSRAGGRALTLNLYLPRTKGPHPVMVVIPGGAWRNTFKWTTFAKTLARDGIATAAISHRGVPKYHHPVQVHDCARALQYLRAHARELELDPMRIGATGISSGGHLAAMLGTRKDIADPRSKDAVARASSRATCVVTFGAPTNLVPSPGMSLSGMQVRMATGYVGIEWRPGDEITSKALAVAQDASPIHHVSKDDAPFLLLHGRRDMICPPEQSDSMYKALKKAGVSCELISLSDAGHAGYISSLRFEKDAKRADDVPPFWRKTRAFLRRHLLGVPPAGEG